MSIASDILDRAQRYGVHVEMAGDKLKLRAKRKPPEDLIADLRGHKTELIAFLSGDCWTEQNEERAAGVPVVVGGDLQTAEATEEPPTAGIDLLPRYKDEFIALLRPANHGWTAQDWQAYYDERAAIAEFDCGLPRDQAEARAFECCVGQWLNRNPICSSPDCCLACGRSDQPANPLLPFGTETNAWLHSACWTAWQASRKREAVATLACLGIGPLE